MAMSKLFSQLLLFIKNQMSVLFNFALQDNKLQSNKVCILSGNNVL